MSPPAAPPPLLDRQQLLSAWTDQNPALVRELEKDGDLDRRLEESLKTAQGVALDALGRNLHPEQARELALDAVSLPTTPDEEDEEDEEE